MLASHSHQWLSKNHQRKWTKSSPVSFEVACVPSPLLCRARSTAARPGSLCWWLPKVLMHSGKTKLTSAFYLLMSNHHLYLSPAWDSAAWNTNAIRSWSLFWKTHIHLAKPYLTHWHLYGSWDSLAINTWLVMKLSIPFYPTPPLLNIWVLEWGSGTRWLERS